MQEQTLQKSTKWSYGFSNNGFFVAMTLYTTYPMIFMTACLNFSVPQAVLILTIAKLIDIAIGLLSGAIIEKVKMPWGKYRSWFLVGPIIAGIACCLFFSPFLLIVPKSAVTPLGIILISIWNSQGTITTNCHGAMNRLLTQNPMERVSMFKLCTQLQSIVLFIAGFFMMKIVFAVGGEQKINLAGMQVIGIIYSALFFVTYFPFFLHLKNIPDPSGPGRKVNVTGSIKLLFTNAKAAALTFPGILCFSSETFYKAVVSFFAINVLANTALMDTYNWAIVIFCFIGASLSTYATKKISKKAFFAFGYFVTAAALVAAYFTVKIPLLCIILVSLAELGIGAGRSVCVPMYSDIADFSKHQNGEEVTSYVMGLFTLLFKVAGLVAAQAFGLIGRVGYVTGQAPAPDVLEGIRKVATLGPASMALAGGILVLICYRLNEKDMPKIRAELRERGMAH